MKYTWPAKSPQHAGTASTLNTAEPTTVPTPISLLVINVPTELMNNSGLDAAAAMNVAPTAFPPGEVKSKIHSNEIRSVNGIHN